MSRVFVVQQPSPSARGWLPDLGPAADHGAINFIFPAKTNLAGDTARWLAHAEHALVNFDPHQDFILDLGVGSVDPVGPVLVAIALAMDPDVEMIRFLRWERHRDSPSAGFYIPIPIKLEAQP